MARKFDFKILSKKKKKKNGYHFLLNNMYFIIEFFFHYLQIDTYIICVPIKQTPLIIKMIYQL